MAQQVVPVGISNKGVQWDAALNTVGFLTESLMFYISSHEMYHSSGTAADRTCFTLDVTDSLDELLHSKVVPLLEVMILCGQDPMPLYAQKILAALLPRYVSSTVFSRRCTGTSATRSPPLNKSVSVNGRVGIDDQTCADPMLS